VSINIDSASNLPVFVSLCLFVISQTLSSSLSSHWFLITLARRTAELCQDAYYASSIVSHSVERRTRCMARNAMAASNLCTVLPAVEVAVESMVQDLVIRRVKDGRDEQGSGPLLKDLASRRHDSSRQLQMETELVLSALRAAGEGSSQAAVVRPRIACTRSLRSSTCRTCPSHMYNIAYIDFRFPSYGRPSISFINARSLPLPPRP
jgi:hypothetical protein